MKRSRWTAFGWSILFLVVVVSGCRKMANPDDVKEKTDTQTTVQESHLTQQKDFSEYSPVISLEKEFNEQMSESRWHGKVDLDMDGTEEQLDFHSDFVEYLDEGIKINRKQFFVNGEEVDRTTLCSPIWYDWMDEQIQESGADDPGLQTVFQGLDVIDLDPADGKREIVIYKALPSYGPLAYRAEVFHYKNGKFVSIGEMDTQFRSTLDETEYQERAIFDPINKSVSFPNTSCSLCCFYYTEIFQLQGDRIVKITPEEKDIFLESQNGKEPLTVNVIGSAKLYRSPNGDEVTYELKPGDEVTFLSTVEGKWIKVKVSNGRVGYLKHVWQEPNPKNPYGGYIFDDDEDKDPSEVFEDLPFWG